eukprot:1568382-Pleurochrysis_carterae.AAC.1
MWPRARARKQSHQSRMCQGARTPQGKEKRSRVAHAHAGADAAASARALSRREAPPAPRTLTSRQPWSGARVVVGGVDRNKLRWREGTERSAPG